MTHTNKKDPNKSGFTIIEIIIALAAAGLIMTIVFVAIPQAQAARRDNYRKTFVGSVFTATEEYYKNNGHLLDPNTANDYARFLAHYMPEGSDPTTGESYKMASEGDVDSVTEGQANPSHSMVIYKGAVSHDVLPEKGQIYIATGHVCQSSHPDGTGTVLSDYAYGKGHIVDVFAVVTYQERGQFFCVDNYQNTNE